MRRGIKANNWELPGNTSVWYWFFLSELIIEAISCVLFLIIPALAATLANEIDQVGGLILEIGGIVITAWCVYKLRAIPSDVAVDVAH
jgi:uncharacterized Tic20 family protein